MRAAGTMPGRASARALAAALAFALGGTEASAQAAFGGPVPGPLEFAALELRSREGFDGDLELLALLSDGSEVTAFAASGLSWTRSVEARFFAPELIVGLELRDPESGATLHAAARAERPDDNPALRSDRALLRALPFPIRGPAGGTPPELQRFEGMDAARAARFATARLFLRPKRLAAAAALAAWTLLAAIAAGLAAAREGGRAGGPTEGETGATEAGDASTSGARRRGTARLAALALVTACAAAAIGAALLAAPEPMAWSLELPGEGEAASFEARLEDSAIRGGGRNLAWTADATGRLAYLAFHAPGGEGIPVASEPGELYRFSSPPRVTLEADGVYRLSAERFLMAWRIGR